MADGSIRFSITGDLSGLNAQLLQAEARAAQSGATVGRNLAGNINTQLAGVGANVSRQGNQIGSSLSNSITSSFSLRGVNATVASTFSNLPSTAASSGSRTGAAFSTSFANSTAGLGNSIHQPIASAVGGLGSLTVNFNNVGNQYGQALNDGMNNSISGGQNKLATGLHDIWVSAVHRISEVITNGIGNAMNTVKGMLSSLVEVGMQVEKVKATFSTLKGSREEGLKLFEQAENFAKDTPFSNEQTYGGVQQLLALKKYRDDTKLLMNDLKMVGDVAAGTGKSLSQVGYVYAQIQTQGVAMAQDTNQLANAGIPIYEELAKVLGTNVDGIKEMRKDGLITADVVEAAFINMTSAGGQFFNSMQNQAATTGGRIEAFKGSLDKLSGKLFEQMITPIGVVMDAVSGAMDRLLETGTFVQAVGVQFASISIIATQNKDAIASMVNDGLAYALDVVIGLVEQARQFVFWMSTPEGAANMRDLALTARDIGATFGQLGGLTIQLVGLFAQANTQVMEISRTFHQVAVISREVWLGWLAGMQGAVDNTNLFFSNVDADLAMFEARGNAAWESFIAHIQRSIDSYNGLGITMDAGLANFEARGNAAWNSFMAHIGRSIESANGLFISVDAGLANFEAQGNAAWSSFITYIGEAINSTTFLGNTLQGHLTAFEAQANSAWNGFLELVSRAIESAISLGENIRVSIGNAIASIFTWWSRFNTNIQKGDGAVAMVARTVNGILRGALQGIVNLVAPLWTRFANSGLSAFNVISAAANRFKNFAVGIPAAIGQAFARLASSVSNMFGSWVQQAQQVGSAIGGALGGAFSGGGGGGGSVVPSGSISSALPGSLNNYGTSAGGRYLAPRPGGRRHAGTDYSAPVGTPVLAPFNAKVISVARDLGEFLVKFQGVVNGKTAIGKFVHMNTFNGRVGSTYKQGQQMGTVGGKIPSWGSSGAHLHYELNVGGQQIGDPRSVSGTNKPVTRSAPPTRHQHHPSHNKVTPHQFHSGFSFSPPPVTYATKPATSKKTPAGVASARDAAKYTGGKSPMVSVNTKVAAGARDPLAQYRARKAIVDRAAAAKAKKKADAAAKKAATAKRVADRRAASEAKKRAAAYKKANPAPKKSRVSTRKTTTARYKPPTLAKPKTTTTRKTTTPVKSRYTPPKLPAYKAPKMPAYKAPKRPVYKAPKLPAYKAPKLPAYKAPKPTVYKAPKLPAYKAPKPLSTTRQTKLPVYKAPKPIVIRQSKPTVTRQSKPTTTRQSKPTVTRQSKPTTTRQSKPTVTRQTKPTTTTRVNKPTTTPVKPTKLTPKQGSERSLPSFDNPSSLTAPRITLSRAVAAIPVDPAKRTTQSLQTRIDRPPVAIPVDPEKLAMQAIAKREAVSSASRSERDMATTRNRAIIDAHHETDIAKTTDPIQKQLKEFAHQRELLERELSDYNKKFNDEIEDAKNARAKKLASTERTDHTDYSGKIDLLNRERKAGQAPFDLKMQKVEIEQAKFLRETNEKLGESYTSLMNSVADLHATYGLNTPEEAHLDKLKSIKKTGDDLTKQLNTQIKSEEQLSAVQGASGESEQRLITLKSSLASITKQMTAAIDAENLAYKESIATKERERLATEASLSSQVAQAQASRLDKRGDVFGANKIKRADAIGTLNREAENQEREMRAKAKEGGWSPEFLDAQLAKLQQLNQFKLTDINAQFQTLGEAIKSKLGDELGNVLTALFEGTKSMMDVLRDSFASIGKWLLQLGIKGLLGGFGLNIGGGFSRGGMIENYAVGGSIGDAFRKERSESGLQPRLVVANVGERILSARETAAYNRMFPGGIPNFASGGLVGIGGIGGAASTLAVNAPITVNTSGGGDVNPNAMRNLQEGLKKEMGQYILAQSQPGGLVYQIMRNR